MKLRDIRNYFNKILIFYYPGRAGYWNSITSCSISEKPSQLSSYYLDFSSKAFYKGEFSSSRIPLCSFNSSTLIEHPTTIAQYALGIFELLNRKNFEDDNLRSIFLEMANWFKMNGNDFKGGKVWFIDIIYPEYGIEQPWISAMTQGEAISVLTRAAWLMKDPVFGDLAEDALVPFEYDVKDGGLVNYFNNIPVYEEGPTPLKTTAVLNGFIFSLFGLYDLFLYNKNNKAEYLFNKGADSLKKLLPYFDIKYWTRYRLMEYPRKYYSSYTYHILVVEQLKVMHYLTGETEFMDYSDKWYKYSKSFINRTRALLNKLTHSNSLSL
jgi:heparosan-N-sulfate-glucuronate 5-epimerase